MKGETNLKIQISLFGDFSHITPTEEVVKNCISAFFQLGMLPAGNVQEIDPSTNRLEPRLSLQSMRNGLSVNFLTNRIDFVVMPLPGTPAASVTTEIFCTQVLEIASSLYKILDISFKRIGFVTEKFLTPLPPEKLEALRRTFTTDAFNIFPEKQSVEWGVRNVVTDSFSGNSESEVNIIYSLSKVKVQIGDSNGHREFETLQLTTDINTIQNKKLSSSNETLSDFIAQAKNREKAIYSGLTSVIYA